MRAANSLPFVLLLVLCRCDRPEAPVLSAGGVVAAASPEAAEAGARILAAGGNAADAAVAISFALAVTEPAMSGLGGQTQVLIYRPGDESALVVNGTSFSPKAVPRGVDPRELRGHRATTVPATVRALDYLFREHGSGKLSWSDVLAPSIGYAEDGFALGRFRHKVLRRHLEDLRSSPSASALFLNPDGSPPAEGASWKQPALARTLRRLADVGAEDFYRGEIARAIAADMEAMAGFVTLDDLAEVPEPPTLPALRGSYRGFDVFTLPPPGGGRIVLRILATLEEEEIETLLPGAAGRLRALALALRAGHGAREAEEGIEKRRLVGETTHFSVVDSAGLAVSVTASINNYYGARVASPELGFLYNDYMREFVSGPEDHPFAVGPGRAPYSSMSPSIVARHGGARLVLGSPGSARIISAVAQVIQLWVDAELTIGDAVSHARIHALGDGRLFLEEGEGDAPSWIEEEGLTLGVPSRDLAAGGGAWNPYFGGVHAVALEEGEWRGAADPRRDGVAIAVPAGPR